MLLPTRYAILSCIELAYNYGKGYINAVQLASLFNVNVRTLSPAMLRLVQAGILKSHKGANPGYALAKPPKEISLYMLINALQGDAYFDCCTELMPDLRCNTKLCQGKEGCLIYSTMNAKINRDNEELKGITLETLANNE